MTQLRYSIYNIIELNNDHITPQITILCHSIFIPQKITEDQMKMVICISSLFCHYVLRNKKNSHDHFHIKYYCILLECKNTAHTNFLFLCKYRKIHSSLNYVIYYVSLYTTNYLFTQQEVILLLLLSFEIQVAFLILDVS